jgi:hypothetical protein
MEIIATKTFDQNSLRRKEGQTWLDALCERGLLFKTKAEAKAGCEYYRTIAKKQGFPIEWFKYKDWNSVARAHPAVVFNNHTLDSIGMRYLWFQSMDLNQGCILRAECIKNIKLVAYKLEKNAWKLVGPQVNVK